MSDSNCSSPLFHEKAEKGLNGNESNEKDLVAASKGEAGGESGRGIKLLLLLKDSSPG